MAINRRPSGWLYDGNPDYEGTTVAERRAIQNQIDLIDAQEESNRLEEKKIEQQYKLALEQKEHELELARLNNESELKRLEQENEYNKKLEAERQNFNNIQRHKNLCDNLNVDYNTLIDFEDILINKSLFAKECLENISSAILIKEQTKRNLNNKLLKIKEQKNNTIIDQAENSNRIIELTATIEKWKTYTRPADINWIMFVTILLGPFCLLAGSFTDAKELQPAGIIMLIIAGLSYLIQCFLFKIKKQNIISNCKREISILSKKDKENLFQTEEEIKLEIQKISKDIKDLINNDRVKTQDNYYRIEKERIDLVEAFNEFRKTHYNKEIELLFKQLELNFDPLYKEDIIQNGNLEDYILYMEKLIKENQ